MLFDIHTHKDSSSNYTIRNFHQKEMKIIERFDYPCSIGLHPWFIAKDNLQKEFAWLSTKSKMKNVVAIGECGLDKNINIDLDKQIEVFKKCIEISEQTKKPLIIHNNKYLDEILKLQILLKPKQKWIIHGFDSHQNMMTQLMKVGFYFSFGHAIFDKRRRAYKSFKLIPLNRVFLETDDSDFNIEDIYIEGAKLKSIEIKVLKKAIEKNFKTVFEWNG